jgi:Damage-control phosphatase ARMT1-like domain
MNFQIDPELFDLLNSSGLTIYKGDLNYRKLVGDVNWKPSTPPAEAFAGCPTPLLALRTLKADVVIGLDNATVARMKDDWMVSGEFAVIQFLDK